MSGTSALPGGSLSIRRQARVRFSLRERSVGPPVPTEIHQIDTLSAEDFTAGERVRGKNKHLPRIYRSQEILSTRTAGITSTSWHRLLEVFYGDFCVLLLDVRGMFKTYPFLLCRPGTIGKPLTNECGSYATDEQSRMVQFRPFRDFWFVRIRTKPPRSLV